MTKNDSNIYLVGGGVVGRAVAVAHLRASLAVRLIEIDDARLGAAVSWITERIDGLSCSEFSPWGESRQCLLTPISAKPQTYLTTPLLIESILERRDVKQHLLAQAAKLLGPTAVLATNTSTLPLATLETDDFDSTQLVGLHFFMPVDKRFLVEVVCGSRTQPHVLDLAMEHVRSIHRRPLLVNDGPGFVVNRMLGPYLNHALLAVCQGASPEQIESVAVTAGMPMGPLELLDLISLDTGYHAGREMLRVFPHRIEPVALLPGMIKQGLKGRHHGIGFYEYDSGQRSAKLSLRAQARISDYTRDERTWTKEELRDWIFLPMLIEAAYILDDQVVSDIDSLELAMSGGLAFRPEGFFFDLWINEDAKKVLAKIDAFAQRSPGFTLPSRFREIWTVDRTVREVMEIYARADRSTDNIKAN